MKQQTMNRFSLNVVLVNYTKHGDISIFTYITQV